VNAATVIDLGDDASRLIVEIVLGTVPETSAELDTRWNKLAARNPRLFNGRILAFLHADLASARLRVRVDEYKRMAAQSPDDRHLTQFGVTGVLTAPDQTARPCVLLGQRSDATHIHPGRWELAPSGGVDAPRPGTTQLSIAQISAQLERELAEETGVTIDGLAPNPIALCHDPDAPSMDVIFRLELGTMPVEHKTTWEYDQLVWVPIDGLKDELDARSIDLIAPSAAVLRWLGWM
jgi:8-oxo-dGTP pyrophosphatase MutT (NUDIX family)